MNRQVQTVISPEDLDAKLDLSRFLEQLTEPAALVGPDGQVQGLPEPIYEVLVSAVDALANDQAVVFASMDQMLTTQQAANFLGISRPTLVKLLEEERIPFSKPTGSRHRRIKLHDLVEYSCEQQEVQREALDELVQIDQEAGLYDIHQSRYQDALKAARGKTSNP